MEIQKPNPANVVHCILYVIRASTNLKDLSTSVKLMIEILKDHDSEGSLLLFYQICIISGFYLLSMLSVLKMFNTVQYAAAKVFLHY